MKWIFVAYPLILLWTACSPEEVLPQAAPCDQQFDPEALIPGSDCENPCRYGYAGEWDWPGGEAVIRCRTDLANFRMFLDSTSLYGPGRVPLQAFVLELDVLRNNSQGAFCPHDLVWEAENWPGFAYKTLFTADPKKKVHRTYIIPEPEFWEREAGVRFRFRFSSRVPVQVH